MGSVTFWENKNLDGDNRVFTGTNLIEDLSEYTYSTNSGKEMDDSISSLESDSGAWLYVFTQHKYEGELLKVNPGTPINDLSDSREFPGTGDTHGFDNTIVSFTQYDYQPNFWSVTNNTSLGNCWVKFYIETRYSAGLVVRSTGSGAYIPCFCVIGAGNCVNALCIDDYIEYDGSIGDGTHTNYAQSLTTGPETWVELFGDINYGSPIAQFGPNSVIPNLSNYGADKMMSFKISDSVPAGWNGSTSTTPAEVLTIQRYQTGDSIEKLLAGVLSCIPFVGGLAKGILGAFWPSSPDIQTVWYDLDSYMTSLFESLIVQIEETVLNDILSGIATQITDYSTMTPSANKATKLEDIISTLEANQGTFVNASSPDQTLNYLVEYGTICVLMLAEQAYNYTTLSGGATDPDATTHAEDLDKAIQNLLSNVDSAQKSALQWRTDQITIVDKGGLSTNYVVTDAYTGFSSEYSDQSDAQTACNNLVNLVTTQYTDVLDAKCSPSYLWSYLDSSNAITVPDSGNSNFPTTKFAALPTKQTINITTGTYGQPTGTYFSEMANGHAVTGINLYSTDNYLCGIQLLYSGQSSGLHGTTGPSALGTYQSTATFEAEESIVALYGGYGSWMDQLFVRTVQATDANGNSTPTAKSRDIGVGGNGGNTFVAAPPQGMGAVITQMEGYVGSYINQLTFHWSYDIWK